MRTSILPTNDPDVFEQAMQALAQEELVAFPTDTVYGVGGLAFSPQAIEKLYIAKGRDTAKAIAVLIGNSAALAEVAGELSPIAQCLAEKFWPGALTLVVARHPALPPSLSPLPTVGVRMPNHPVALALLNRAGPMAVTSANLSGQPSTTTAQEVYEQLQGRIALILDGGHTPGGVPSTVVDCTGPELVVLREGPISRHQLLAALT